MENKETVLVTGGSGFIASHCIIQLAAAGYKVKATVRDLSRTNKLNQTLLNGLEKHEGKSDLSVDWQVTNLSSDEGWDEAMAGCDYVLHVASPIAMQLPKDEDEMVKPAVEGTLRVLKAASKAGVTMTKPEAAGKRFVCSAENMFMKEQNEYLSEIFPESASKIPKRVAPNWLIKFLAFFLPPLKMIAEGLGKERSMDSSQAKNLLGWSPRSAKEAVKSAAESAKEYGLIND